MSDISASAARLILVVEDEELIGDVVEGYLEELGFCTLRAANATEAIDALINHEDISLVFSDVVMPGAMDGFGLARWIRGHYPRMRVLLTSGYWGLQRPDLDAPPLLPKPYSLDDLGRYLGDPAGV